MLLSGHGHQHGRQQPPFLLILSTCRLCQAPQPERIQSLQTRATIHFWWTLGKPEFHGYFLSLTNSVRWLTELREIHACIDNILKNHHEGCYSPRLWGPLTRAEVWSPLNAPHSQTSPWLISSHSLWFLWTCISSLPRRHWVLLKVPSL